MIQHHELQLTAMVSGLAREEEHNVKLLISYMRDRREKRKSGSITFNTNREGITEPGKHRIELTA